MLNLSRAGFLLETLTSKISAVLRWNCFMGHIIGTIEVGFANQL